MKILLCFYHLSDLLKLRCVSITLAMFWNNETCFYHFSDLLKQCDVFPSLWRSFETIWCGFITLAMVWNNAMCFYHYSECWNKCDVFLSLKRWFETMQCVSITLAMVWNNAISFYPFSNGLKQLRGLSDEFYHFLINSVFLKTTSSVIFF